MATNNAINSLRGTTKVTSFTSNGTWTKDENAIRLTLLIWAGGGGGGSGRQGTIFSGGGAGGANGTFLFYTQIADFFSATEPVVIGLGGTGGAAQINNNTDGLSGTVGGNSLFGNFIVVPGGNPGGGGSTVRMPGTEQAEDYANNSFGAFLPVRQTGFGGRKENGGDADMVDGVNLTTGFKDSILVASRASGGGGGGSSSNANFYSGGHGGDKLFFPDIARGIIPGGTAGISDGADGGDGPDGFIDGGCVIAGSGGGGGGGMTLIAPSNGGDGGFRAGGGGGGGGSLNGTNSGAGGSGGNGEVLVIELLT